MAFIRRVRTASGATAVQIAEYANRRQRIVKHVGSAHTEAELGVLLERARQVLADPGQGVLDVGIEPSPAVAELLSQDGGDDRLFVLGHEQEPSAQTGRASSGRVVGTNSRVLYETLAGVYADLGFEAVADEVFRDLVIVRVVEPTSLLDTGRVLAELGQGSASYSTLQRTLKRAGARGYRDTVAKACFMHVAARGDLSLLHYDLTSLYFEADQEDSLRKVGYSMERRVDPQIVVGLARGPPRVSPRDWLLEGNEAEKRTIVPIVEQFQARHGLADLVVVADAGMLSAANLTALDEAGLRFRRRAPRWGRAHGHWPESHATARRASPPNHAITEHVRPHVARRATSPTSRPRRCRSTQVITAYHDLWHVEQSFRMSKSDLRARPLFARSRDSIQAHLTIVFTALAISREIQARTGLAIRNVITQLRPLRSASLAINGTTQTFPPQIPAEQQAILDAIRADGSHALTD